MPNGNSIDRRQGPQVQRSWGPIWYAQGSTAGEAEIQPGALLLVIGLVIGKVISCLGLPYMGILG